MPIIPGNIERYLADKFAGQNEPFQPFDRDLSVAIIGSGPAGLSCALELAQMVFNQQSLKRKNILAEY